MAYEPTEGEMIRRIADNAFIPPDPANTDYQAYLAWRQGEEKVRARNEDGTYKGDDPATPEVNEAWTDGST
jgi:hypothetical protein